MLKKISIGVMSLLALFGVKSAYAAADADLTAALASSTLVLTDNKGQILTWLVALFGVVILITIVIGALSRARRQIGGAVGGGKKRR